MNKKLIVTIIIVSLLALTVGVILLRRQPQETNNESGNQNAKYINSQSTTSQSSSSQTNNQFNVTTDAKKIYATDKSTITPDTANQVLTIQKSSQTINLKLGNYPIPRSIPIISSSGRLAAAIFPVPTTADSTWLVLSDKEAPTAVHASIENIAGITNDGRTIYHAEDTKGNIIAIGKPDRTDERVLAQVTDK